MKDENIGGSGMLVIAALLLALGMVGGGYLISQSSPPNYTTNPNVYVSSTPNEHAISVLATATQKVAPDLLVVELRVETESTNAKESQQQNSVVMNDLLAKLKALGIADKDIQTSSYTVNPITESEYVCDAEGYKCHYNYSVSGYRTTHRLTVNVEQLSKGGDVIDTAATAGTNQTFVDSVSFTLKESTRSEMMKTLLGNASAAAKVKAQKIADGLGVSVGDVLSASENSYVIPYYSNNYRDMMEAAAPTTTISPGEVDLSASVSVSYEVE